MVVLSGALRPPIHQISTDSISPPWAGRSHPGAVPPLAHPFSWWSVHDLKNPLRPPLKWDTWGRWEYMARVAACFVLIDLSAKTGRYNRYRLKNPFRLNTCIAARSGATETAFSYFTRGGRDMKTVFSAVAIVLALVVCISRAKHNRWRTPRRQGTPTR